MDVNKEVGFYLGNAKLRALADESFLFWLSVGLSRVHAVGLVAQEFGESRSNINANGDMKHAFGLFQHHRDRIAAIKIGCGIDLTTFPPHLEQLKAAWWELQHTEKNALKHLQLAQTAYMAGYNATRYWERPGNMVDWDTRGKVADLLLKSFNERHVGDDHRTEGHA